MQLIIARNVLHQQLLQFVQIVQMVIFYLEVFALLVIMDVSNVLPRQALRALVVCMDFSLMDLIVLKNAPIKKLV